MAVLSTRLPTREQTAQAGARPVRVLHILPTLAGGGMELAAVRLIRGSRGARVSPAGEDATNAFPSPVDEQACSRERPVQSPAATERQGQGRHSVSFVHGLCILKEAEIELIAQCQSQARIWVFGEGPNLTTRMCTWWRLRQVIRQFRPDIVHARSTGVWPDAALATRGLKTVKLLLSFHGKTNLARPSFKRRLLNRWAAARADAVLAVSDDAAEHVRAEWGIPAAKLSVIRNGVDVEQFHPAASADEILRVRGELGLRGSDQVVICVANFMPIKGIDVLLRAWPAVVAGRPGGRHLLLLGEGPLQAQLQSLAWNLGCRQSVLFAGCRENVAELLRAADLFVLPSHYEACSNAILEALASGLPAVACDVGGNRELVAQGASGWLVPPGSPKAMAECIANALGDEANLRRIGQAARHQALTVNPESVWLATYHSLYAALAAGPGDGTEADPCAG